MKILTQNLRNGKTNLFEVPSPTTKSNKIRVLNEFSLISTGTESSIVNFGKGSWFQKALQQPDKVKDVINKIKSSGLTETFKAVNSKLNFPMVMGYSAVGRITHKNNYNLNIGKRVFTNSCHQEESLVDYNMCVEIPENLDSKSSTFGSIGGIAMQSINCIPNKSKTIVIIGLGLLGQITLRILLAKGFKCLAYDLDKRKVDLAIKFGAVGIKSNIIENVTNFTKGEGADCTIISAASDSSKIINDATYFTKRKGKIISSGVIGLNLVRDNFFKKQIEIVVSNSSGDKTHRGKGSSYQNIIHFFELLSLKKVKVLDLISDEVNINESNKIYDFNNNSIFFSRLIKYDYENYKISQSYINKPNNKQIKNFFKVGLIGAGNFALRTIMPYINKSNLGYNYALLGREGLSLHIAQKKFNVDLITTNEKEFFKEIDVAFITTPHNTHYNFLKKAIQISMPIWVEKPMVISIKELLDIRKMMLKNNSFYAIGYNRSFAPWTNFICNKIKNKITNIKMIINAGKLPSEHWLLDKKISGGRIIGEFCHFIDLSISLLKHTFLSDVYCIRRDKYYQDTGDFLLTFNDGSKVEINYRSDMPPSIPKEKIIVNSEGVEYVNNNWNKFNKINILGKVKKGKGHEQAISLFLNKIKEKKYTSYDEINHMCFSTYTAINLQKMKKGDNLKILRNYEKEIIG